jgi:hypothetical protein
MVVGFLTMPLAFLFGKERTAIMINLNTANPTNSNWPTNTQRPSADAITPSSGAEAQKLKEAIEKEERELKRITEEFSERLSSGEQDIAKLKAAELAQKQMQIQALRSQVDRLEKSAQAADAVSPSAEVTLNSGRPRFDRLELSGAQPEVTPGIYSLEKDENGNPMIVIDGAEPIKAKQAADSTATESAEADKAPPETAAPEDGEKPEESEDGDKKMVEVGKSIADDSEWRAEIAKIKQKKAELAQKMNTVREDPEKRRALEAQIAAVDAELAAKDTDSYRRQRTTVRYLGSTMMSAEDAMKLS